MNSSYLIITIKGLGIDATTILISEWILPPFWKYHIVACACLIILENKNQRRHMLGKLANYFWSNEVLSKFTVNSSRRNLFRQSIIAFRVSKPYQIFESDVRCEGETEINYIINKFINICGWWGNTRKQ